MGEGTGKREEDNESLCVRVGGEGQEYRLAAPLFPSPIQMQGLWRGNLAGQLMTAPYTTAQFVALHQCKVCFPEQCQWLGAAGASNCRGFYGREFPFAAARKLSNSRSRDGVDLGIARSDHLKQP